LYLGISDPILILVNRSQSQPGPRPRIRSATNARAASRPGASPWPDPRLGSLRAAAPHPTSTPGPARRARERLDLARLERQAIVGAAARQGFNTSITKMAKLLRAA